MPKDNFEQQWRLKASQEGKALFFVALWLELFFCVISVPNTTFYLVKILNLIFSYHIVQPTYFFKYGNSYFCH